MMCSIVLVAVTAVGLSDAQPRKVDFTHDTVDQPPTGFDVGHAGTLEGPSNWLVEAEGENKYLAHLDGDPTGAPFRIAVLADVTTTEVDVSVRFRPVSGRVEEAAGLVWRYQDANNHYLVRANALEGNVKVYKIQNGRRTDLPVKGERDTYGKPSRVPSGAWGTLRVFARGSLFEVYHDGRKLYAVEDTTFRQGGKVGVWTNADAVTNFDDLTVVTP
jgi:hypothetical protein